MSSRESDNAYPPPRRGGTPSRRPGEGPDAYPSGTPPYGTPGVANGYGAGAPLPGGDPFSRPGPATDGAAGAAEPDVPKTETTLTTRISINIPGSRPIPPVVMRSTVKPEEPEAAPAEQPGPTGPRHRSGSPASPVIGVMETGARGGAPLNLPPEWQTPPNAPEPAESESTGEWFRPRQKSRPEPAAAPAPTPTPAPAPVQAQAQAQAQNPAASGPAAGSPYESNERWQPTPQFSAESTQQIPAPRPTGAPASPFAPAFGTGNEPAPVADQGFPTGGGQQFGKPQGGYPADPYAGGPAAEPYQNGAARDPFTPRDPFARPAETPAPAADPFGTGPAAPRRPQGQGAPGRFARSQPPAGPFPPAAAAPPVQPAQQGFAEGRFATEQNSDAEDTQIGGFRPISDDIQQGGAIPGLPVNGMYGGGPQGAPRLAGTAMPPAPAGARPAGPPPPPGPLAAGPAGPSGHGAHAGPPEGPTPEAPAAPGPAAKPKPASAAKPKPRPRAQKLLVYAVGGALFVGSAAYGTGLMLNQADVPRGITVLGTDIGGDSRDQAIHQLDATVGKIGQQPIQLKIGGQALTLDPATAGLSFDTTATVDSLTKHSYSPVDVISSLTGDSKAVPPQVRVDQAKLKVALDQLAGQSAQGLKEGFVQFNDPGDPSVVPGQAGQAVDGNAAVNQVQQSYQDRAAGKSDPPISLAVTAAQPKVSQQALQQAADGLGKQIVSAKVTVVAGSRRFVFTRTIASKTLTLGPDASGTIGPQWNLDQLNSAMGGVFDRIKFRKADGTTALITPQDVADGIASVFANNGDTERTFKFRS
ncbi:peptidoglycan binding domain-containing protein [Kitasatospora mediocidica]|uniref:peptidoglycan binding domain-containing protein n=1 Tax=Kitasatospora mediocidica TaxID=58352 RepID=UPI00055E3CCF|nr:peptidoglycan binding domain-containing protein [Kitasatospora mediocidica]